MIVGYLICLIKINKMFWMFWPALKCWCAGVSSRMIQKLLWWCWPSGLTKQKKKFLTPSSILAIYQKHYFGLWLWYSIQPYHNSHYIVMIREAYVTLEAVGSNKVYLYLRRLESQVKAELSHWCNNLTWAGPGCRDSHQTDKDVHKRIYIGCHRVYRFLSGTYRCNIHAHAQ